jgi:hypothetical protein
MPGVPWSYVVSRAKCLPREILSSARCFSASKVIWTALMATGNYTANEPAQHGQRYQRTVLAGKS